MTATPLTPEQKQTLVQALNTLNTAKAAFDAADLALTHACKAYHDAQGVAAHINDWDARLSR